MNTTVKRDTDTFQLSTRNFPDKHRKRNLIFWCDYLYLVPAVILVLIFFVCSILFTLFLSFHSWNGFGAMKFNGFSNYINLFTDPNFKTSVIITLTWVASSLIIPFFIPLILAVAITNSSYASFFKKIFYFPHAISGTVGGLIMLSMLSVYSFPHLLGMIWKPFQADWLNIPYTNTIVMILVGTWQGIGNNLILFIVGLNNLPPEPIEAARLEGAAGASLYTKVIFPLLAPTVEVVLLMSLVNSFKVFDNIWIMTKGGPYRTSETLALMMYEESFVNNKLGYGSAIAVVLTIVILFVSYFYLKNSFKRDER
jgi:multiple sugar transport system permease protein